MDTAMDTLRRDMGAGFAEVNARIVELHREVLARIDALRKEMLENFKLIEAKIEQVRKEIQNSRKENDGRFRSLVGLMVVTLLGMMGLFAKAARFY